MLAGSAYSTPYSLSNPHIIPPPLSCFPNPTVRKILQRFEPRSPTFDQLRSSYPLITAYR